MSDQLTTVPSEHATGVNIEVVRRLQEELFSNARLQLADELLTADFVDHEAPPGSPSGPASAKGTVSWLHSCFDDINYEVDDIFGADDRVALRCHMSGTHVGEFFGLAPTGRRFRVQQIHTFRIDGGRVAEHWACRDDAGMMRQLSAG
jgi:predicted SnoaL-like aldol condensation-catalyzing enzyme